MDTWTANQITHQQNQNPEPIHPLLISLACYAACFFPFFLSSLFPIATHIPRSICVSL